MVFRGKLIVIVGQEGQLVLDNAESIPLFRVGTLGRGFDSIQIQSGYMFSVCLFGSSSPAFLSLSTFIFLYIHMSLKAILRTHYKKMIIYYYYFFQKGSVIGKQKCPKMKASCLSCLARKMENGNVIMIIDNTTRADSF